MYIYSPVEQHPPTPGDKKTAREGEREKVTEMPAEAVGLEERLKPQDRETPQGKNYIGEKK